MKALSPLIVFLVLYLVTSIVAQDFYKVPIAVAFLISSVYALLTVKGTMNERISIFAKGSGSSTMMLMLAIFILAGAFAASAKMIGAVDATVNLALKYLPEQAILPGIFLASCFISLSIGTSCGTIAALTPLAVGIAQQSDISIPLPGSAEWGPCDGGGRVQRLCCLEDHGRHGAAETRRHSFGVEALML